MTSTPRRRLIERFVVDDPVELTTLDWTPLRRFEPVGGEAVDHPLYLVCTHGSHDACCARFGRPVAQALSAAFGDQVWEVSHVGGDRFAGNLVCLPDGIYYGRVTAENARQLVERHLDGHIELSSFRGRSFFNFVAQAADHHVRTQRGLTGIDAVLPVGVTELGEDTFAIDVRTPDDERLRVTLARRPASQPQQLTCGADGPHRPPRYDLISVEAH